MPGNKKNMPDTIVSLDPDGLNTKTDGKTLLYTLLENGHFETALAVIDITGIAVNNIGPRSALELCATNTPEGLMLQTKLREHGIIETQPNAHHDPHHTAQYRQHITNILNHPDEDLLFFLDFLKIFPSHSDFQSAVARLRHKNPLPEHIQLLVEQFLGKLKTHPDLFKLHDWAGLESFVLHENIFPLLYDTLLLKHEALLKNKATPLSKKGKKTVSWKEASLNQDLEEFFTLASPLNTEDKRALEQELTALELLQKQQYHPEQVVHLPELRSESGSSKLPMMLSLLTSSVVAGIFMAVAAITPPALSILNDTSWWQSMAGLGGLTSLVTGVATYFSSKKALSELTSPESQEPTQKPTLLTDEPTDSVISQLRVQKVTPLPHPTRPLKGPKPNL